MVLFAVLIAGVLAAGAVAGTAVGAGADGVSQSDDTALSPNSSELSGSSNPILFEQQSRQVARGTIEEITLTFDNDTDDGLLRIEDSVGSYVANVSVRPNDDRQATVRWNTFTAGHDETTFEATTGDIEVIDEFEIPTDVRLIEDQYHVTAYDVEGDAFSLASGFNESTLTQSDEISLFVFDPSDRFGSAQTRSGTGAHLTAAPGNTIENRTIESGVVPADGVAVGSFSAVGLDGLFGGPESPSAVGFDVEFSTVDRNETWTLADDGIELRYASANDRAYAMIDIEAVNAASDSPTIHTGDQHHIRISIDESFDYVGTSKELEPWRKTIPTDRSVLFRDRVTLTDGQAWNDRPLYVDGFDENESVEITVDETPATVRPADPNGVVAVSTEQLGVGEYRLIDKNGTVDGPLTVSQFDFGASFTSDPVQLNETAAIELRSTKPDMTVSLEPTELSPETLVDGIQRDDAVVDNSSVLVEIDGTEDVIEFDRFLDRPTTLEIGVSTPRTAEQQISTELLNINKIDVDPLVAHRDVVVNDADGEAITAATAERSQIARGDALVLPFPAGDISLDEDVPLETAFNVTAHYGNYDLDSPSVSIARDEQEDIVYGLFDTDITESFRGTTLELSVNQSADGVAPDPVGTATTRMTTTGPRVTLENLAPFTYGDRLTPGQIDVEATTNTAPGSEFVLQDGSTASADKNGSLTFQYDVASAAVGDSVDLNSSVTGRMDTTVNRSGVVVSQTTIDRAALSETPIDCCGVLSVEGVDPEATVTVETDDGVRLQERTADASGTLHIDTARLSPGQYALAGPNGVDAFTVEPTSIERFELNRTSVAPGEELSLTVETAQEEVLIELLQTADNGGSWHVDSSGTTELLPDTQYLSVEDGSATTTIDTEGLDSGQYHLGVAESVPGTGVSFEVEEPVQPADELAVAPLDAIRSDDTAETVAEQTTPYDTVALQDIAAVELNTSLDDPTATLEADDGTQWTLEEDGLSYHDGDKRAFVTVDTAAVNDDTVTESIASGTAYTLTVEGENYSTSEPIPVVERTVDLTGAFQGSPTQYLVEPTEASAVTAETTIAPGSAIFVRVRGRLPAPFLQDTTVLVDEHGTATATFNLTAREPFNEFTTTARDRAGDTEEQSPSLFVPEPQDTPRTYNTPGLNPTRLTEVGGVEQYDQVSLWRVENGSPVEPVTRYSTGASRSIQVLPRQLENGEAYAFVQQGEVSTTFVATRAGPYLNDDNRVDLDGVRFAVQDWAAGDIDTKTLTAVIDVWASGEPVPNH